MNPRLFLVAILTALSAAGAAVPFDETKPYGRACVSLVDGTARMELPLGANTKPGATTSVTVHLDANSPCEAVVAAFAKKDGRLAFGWRPAAVALPEWEEKTVGKERWAWKEAGDAFEVFVLFFAPGAAELAPIKQLVGAMQEGKSEGALLEKQTNKLRELIGRAVADKDAAKFSAKERPKEVAGVMRGDGFAWRQFARGANFTETQPGVLIFPSALGK